MRDSEHALIRCQQRGIPPLVIDLLVQFGASEIADGGATKYYFDKASRRKVKAYMGPLQRSIDQHLDVYAVLASDSTVVTVGHRTKRIRRH